MNFELWELMKSRERFDVLKHVLYSRGEHTVTGISSHFGISKGLVSGYLRLLEEFGILERMGRTYILTECPIVYNLKRTINISRIDPGHFQDDWIEGVGVYGSWRSGTNFEESDLDLWFRVRMNPG
ncbi:MAG: ArsR family transcriptional regulator, partial [Thermoplasmata archaeon]|nr:ArsR family transcriptional regulator [Thermoplasmata archaeon]